MKEIQPSEHSNDRAWRGHARRVTAGLGLAGSVAVDADATPVPSPSASPTAAPTPAPHTVSARDTQSPLQQSPCSAASATLAADDTFVKHSGALTSADRTALEAQIGADESGLTALDTTIQGDTTYRAGARRLRAHRHGLPRVRHGGSEDSRGHRGRRCQQGGRDLRDADPASCSRSSTRRRCRRPSRRRRRPTSTTSPARSTRRIRRSRA